MGSMQDEKRPGGRQRSLSDRVAGKLSRVGWHTFKSMRRLSPLRTEGHKQILMILGCQRSGTTMITKIFDADLNSEVHSEHSRALTSDDRETRLRLNAIAKIRKTFDSSRAPLIVIKPLVESQRAEELLEYFANAKVLWVYRHYEDVISSYLSRFGLGSGVRDLRAIVDNAPHNWRAERVPETLRAIVTRHFRDDMEPYDAAALFWYVRNSLFFHMRLDQNPRVMLLHYETLVANPLGEIERLYRFLGRSAPIGKAAALVHDRSVGGGAHVALSPEIRDLCEQLSTRLNACAATDTIDHPLFVAQSQRPAGGWSKSGDRVVTKDRTL